MGTTIAKDQARRGARRLIAAMIVLLAALVGTWFVLEQSAEPAADDWEVLAGTMGSGDPSLVVARSSAQGWEIDVAIGGDVPVSEECAEPLIQSVLVDDEPATVVVLMQWPSRGCETGPKQFTIRLTGLAVPFRVVVRGQPCQAVDVTAAGIFALQPTDEGACQT